MGLTSNQRLCKQPTEVRKFEMDFSSLLGSSENVFVGWGSGGGTWTTAVSQYNTGIGNVSKTLSGTTKLKPAAEAANKMTRDELYNKLVTKLEYKEAGDYLKRGWERKDKYKI